MNEWQCGPVRNVFELYSFIACLVAIPTLASLGFAMRGLGDGVSTTVPVRDGVVNWDKKRAGQLFTALANDERPPDSSLGP